MEWNKSKKMAEHQHAAEMCRVLTKADIKAICQARGFSSREVLSTNHLENFFLSSIGLEDVLTSLKREEVALLHYLSTRDDGVDITFFKSVYSMGRRSGYTFTETYKNLFNQVRDSLIRKGVLLIWLRYSGMGQTTKLERYHFAFPDSFKPFLPLPFSPETLPCQSEGVCDASREKFLEIEESPLYDAPYLNKKDSFALINRELFLGQEAFSYPVFTGWQKRRWLHAQEKKKDAAKSVDAILYATSLLSEQEWLTPEDLKPLLTVFASEADSKKTETLCVSGVEKGVLVRYEHEGMFYYRRSGSAVKQKFKNFFTVNQNGSLYVNLRLVPYDIFDIIISFSHLNLTGKKLCCEPDFLKLARFLNNEKPSPVLEWLVKNSPVFEKCVSGIRKKRFKQIVHSNLIVARVSDLSLKVKIEKELGEGGKLLSLSREFLVFPVGMAGQVEKIVRKTGYVVKRKPI